MRFFWERNAALWERNAALLGARRNFFGEHDAVFWETRHATSLLMPPSAFSLVAHRLCHILPLPAKGGEIYSDDFGAMKALGYVAVAYLAEIGRELAYQEL